VKDAREKLGLSQTDLAFKAKEKLTVIQKIELGKILPTMRLTKELEHILRVKLLAPRAELEVSTVPVRQAGPREQASGAQRADPRRHCHRTTQGTAKQVARERVRSAAAVKHYLL